MTEIGTQSAARESIAAECAEDRPVPTDTAAEVTQRMSVPYAQGVQMVSVSVTAVDASVVAAALAAAAEPVVTVAPAAATEPAVITAPAAATEPVVTAASTAATVPVVVTTSATATVPVVTAVPANVPTAATATTAQVSASTADLKSTIADAWAHSGYLPMHSVYELLGRSSAVWRYCLVFLVGYLFFCYTESYKYAGTVHAICQVAKSGREMMVVRSANAYGVVPAGRVYAGWMDGELSASSSVPCAYDPFTDRVLPPADVGRSMRLGFVGFAVVLAALHFAARTQLVRADKFKDIGLHMKQWVFSNVRYFMFFVFVALSLVITMHCVAGAMTELKHVESCAIKDVQVVKGFGSYAYNVRLEVYDLVEWKYVSKEVLVQQPYEVGRIYTCFRDAENKPVISAYGSYMVIARYVAIELGCIAGLVAGLLLYARYGLFNPLPEATYLRGYLPSEATRYLTAGFVGENIRLIVRKYQT